MNPLIAWVKEPQLWDKEKQEKANTEYNTPPTVTLHDLKQDALKNLYWWKKETIPEITEQIEDKEANKQRAEQLFYNPETIEKIIKSGVSDNKEQEARLEKFNSPEYQEDLEIIMWNFSTDIEWWSLAEIFEKWWAEDSFTINEALNIAFKMEIEVVLDGKANYSTETINRLITSLELWDPFKKLDIFEEIKGFVNTKEATWKKQDIAFRDMKKWSEAQELSLEQQFENLKEKVQKVQQEWNKEKLIELQEDLKILKEEAISSGDVFVAGDIDKLNQKISNEEEQA
jgi:hypothetical protein